MKAILDTTTRTCSKCFETKSIDGFAIDRLFKCGRKRWCRPCANEHGRNYKKLHAKRLADKQRENALKNPDRHKGYKIKHKYGCTIETYNQLFKRQNGVCAICLKPDSIIRANGTSPLSIDHDHSTGVIRGLLCARCNGALGLLREDRKIIQNLLDYLSCASGI